MSSLQSALSKDSKHSLCYGETALIPCISIINLQISKQQTGGGRVRRTDGGVATHADAVRVCVREQETENRRINTQTEGGRGQKKQNTGERMASKATDTADVQNKVSYRKRPHGTI